MSNLINKNEKKNNFFLLNPDSNRILSCNKGSTLIILIKNNKHTIKTCSNVRKIN